MRYFESIWPVLIKIRLHLNMKRFLLFIASCCVAVQAFTQSPKIDSIKHAIRTSVDRRAKLRAMLGLCEMFETLPKDTLWKYALEARALSVGLKDAHGMSLAVISQANAYLEWNNIDSVKALIEPELLKYKPADPATRDIYFKLRHLKLDCISATTDYKDAIAEAYHIIQEAEKYKDSLAMAESLNSLSIYKYEMDFTKNAITIGLRGLALTSPGRRYDDIIINLSGNLAEYYYYLNKLDSAMYYADKTYNLSARSGYLHFESWALQKKSAIYLKAKQYKKAEDAILKSMLYDAEIDGTEPRDDNLVALADVYNEMHEFDKAIKVINDGIAYYNSPKNLSPHAKHDTSRNGVQRIFLYRMLARSYHLKGDSKNFEALLEKIINMTDAVYQANSAQAIADFETKYQVQKKEATIAQQQLALVRENYLFYGSVVIAGLGAIIAFLIFREVRRKQRLKLQQLHEEERLLSEKAVAEAEETERRRIAADLHDNLGAQLSFIKRNVDFIMDQPAGFSQADERKYLGAVNDIAQNAMIDLRETLWVLNKDEVSVQEFADKLKSYLKQQLMSRDMIKWDFKEHIQENWRLPSGEVMHLFRIVQEVISNIIKHAEAEKISIQFDSDVLNSYQLEIFDNGKGFDINNTYNGHYGLENIQQRAKEILANIRITSSPDAGTSMILTKN
jgi:signal transduction histidine kinase